MNDLESKLRESLDRNIGASPLRSLSDDVRRRTIKARRRTIGARALLAIVVIGVAVAGVRLAPKLSAEAPMSGGRWPVVTKGDPRDAYVSTAEVEDIMGLRYILASGSVDGRAYSLEGWTSRRADAGYPTPCLYLAGPADPQATPVSPGPQPPGGAARDSGVGGYCLPDAGSAEAGGWPVFPSESDLLFRTLAPGGAGVCQQCTVGSRGPFAGMGFASNRVDSLSITMDDGASHSVPVLRFPNAWGVSAFIYFQPDVEHAGTLRAYDKVGRPLATAALCDSWTCDMPKMDQIAPIPDTPSPPAVEAPTYPYFAATGDWPEVTSLDEARRPDQALFASDEAWPLVWGSVDGADFDAYIDPTAAPCDGEANFVFSAATSGVSAAKQASICTSLETVPEGGSWFIQTKTGVVGPDVIVMGVANAQYGDIRVTLDDGSSQYLRLFKAPDDPALRYFVAIVPGGHGGNVFLNAPDGTYIDSQEIAAEDASMSG